MKLYKKILFTLLIALNTNAIAGGSSVNNGGDWFVRSLPLLKIQLPEDFGVIEGVQYKKVGLRKCDSHELSKLNDSTNIPDKINAIYLPDRNWNAFRVLIENRKTLLCSMGLVDNNPETSLQTLTNNEDTNRILYAHDPKLGQILKYSKSLGTTSRWAYETALGTFLTSLDPGGVYFGYNLQNGFSILGFPRSLYFNKENHPEDYVYIPLSIQDHNRTYFVQTVIDNSKAPVWRVILPVALNSDDIPLAALSKSYLENTDASFIGFQGIKFDPFTDPQITKQVAWTSANQTPTSQKLRLELISKYGVSEYAAMSSPDDLEPILKVIFLPSISNGQLNHPAFQHNKNGGEIILPIVNQRWRIGADVVHELTHALQTPCLQTCTDDQLFQMEMEAHLNERQHIKEMRELFPLTQYADDTFNFLVAASLPNIVWTTSVQKPIERHLCEDVISGYNFDAKKIKKSSFKKFNCPATDSMSGSISRRIK